LFSGDSWGFVPPVVRRRRHAVVRVRAGVFSRTGGARVVRAIANHRDAVKGNAGTLVKKATGPCVAGGALGTMVAVAVRGGWQRGLRPRD